MSSFPLLFDLGPPSPTTRDIARHRQGRRHRRADRGGAPRRRGALPGSHLPLGAEPRQGDAVRLDAEPVSRLHARLPLLLRAPLSRAVRDGRRRRVRVGHPREAATSSRCSRASSIGRRGRARWSRSAPPPIRISRSRGTTSCRAASIQALTRGRTPFGLITKGPMVVRDIDVLLEHARAARAHGLHERADGGRGRVAAARAGHRAPAAAAARGPRAGRRRRQRRRADGADRPRLLVVAAASSKRTIKAIADHGARFVGCNVMYLQDGTRDHFMRFIEREFPAMAPRFERLYAKKYPPERLPQGSAGDGAACCRIATGCGNEKRRTRSRRPSSSARVRTGGLRVVADVTGASGHQRSSSCDSRCVRRRCTCGSRVSPDGQAVR